MREGGITKKRNERDKTLVSKLSGVAGPVIGCDLRAKKERGHLRVCRRSLIGLTSGPARSPRGLPSRDAVELFRARCTRFFATRPFECVAPFDWLQCQEDLHSSILDLFNGPSIFVVRVDKHGI